MKGKRTIGPHLVYSYSADLHFRSAAFPLCRGIPLLQENLAHMSFRSAGQLVELSQAAELNHYGRVGTAIEYLERRSQVTRNWLDSGIGSKTDIDNENLRYQ